ALDVAGKRIPDNPQFLIRTAPVAPTRQNDMRPNCNLHVIDRTATVGLSIANLRGELHIGGAGVAFDRAIYLRTLRMKLVLDLRQRIATDGEIAIAADERCGRGWNGQGSKQRNSKEKAIHDNSMRDIAACPLQTQTDRKVPYRCFAGLLQKLQAGDTC